MYDVREYNFNAYFTPPSTPAQPGCLSSVVDVGAGLRCALKEVLSLNGLRWRDDTFGRWWFTLVQELLQARPDHNVVAAHGGRALAVYQVLLLTSLGMPSTGEEAGEPAAASVVFLPVGTLASRGGHEEQRHDVIRG